MVLVVYTVILCKLLTSCINVVLASGEDINGIDFVLFGMMDVPLCPAGTYRNHKETAGN